MYFNSFREFRQIITKKYLGIENYKKCIKNVGKNTYIDNNYYRLPWNTKYNKPSVETFNYKFELNNNNLEFGGHEGLINNGFYDYLILFRNHDKLNLNKYIFIKSCNESEIYKLKELNN